jgi:hypothetical protein
MKTKKPAPPKEATFNPTITKNSNWHWILLILSLVFVLIARLQLLNMPLERDEGGFAYIGQQLFGDKLLYKDVFDNKLPGLYFVYWIFTILPFEPTVRIHVGLLLVHSATLYLFFLLVKKMFNEQIAAISTALFAINAILPNVLGFAAHATQLMLLPVIGALLLLWKTQNTENNWKNLILSGLLLGFAFIIKQPAVVFIVFALLILMTDDKPIAQRLQRSLGFGLAATLPYLAVAAYFKMQGRFSDFWYWTFQATTEQTISKEENALYLNKMLPLVTHNNWLFWAMGLVSLVLILFLKYTNLQKKWALGLMISSLLSCVIGLGYSQHYFVTALPWLSLGSVLLFFALQEKYVEKSSLLAPILSFTIVLLPILFNFEYFTRPNPLKIADEMYHWNGFPELQAIGTALNKRLKPGESIAVLGSEPQLNYYTNTKNSSPHIFTYSLVRSGPHQREFQQQYVKDIFEKQPTYIVISSSAASWAADFEKSSFFKDELFQKVKEQYNLIGRANIGQMPLSIFWEEELRTKQPPSCPPIFVFRRK